MSETFHPFLLHRSDWLGEGTIQLVGSDEKIHFYTRWIVAEMTEEGEIFATQEVELVGSSEEKMVNHFKVYSIDQETFSLTIENDQIGSARGKGVLKEKQLAWEFREQGHFEGFEMYDLVEADRYQFHAEYLSDQFRSLINGELWKKTVL